MDVESSVDRVSVWKLFIIAGEFALDEELQKLMTFSENLSVFILEGRFFLETVEDVARMVARLARGRRDI